MSKNLGKISEVFASIQGEGLTVGTMQLFVRTYGCNLRCKYCDVKEHLVPEDTFTIRIWPGHRVIRLSNPISAEKLFEKIASTFPLEKFYSVSFTGGEPLFQTNFLQEFLPLFKKSNIPTFIETNGTLYKEFDRLEPLVSLWSSDLKLSKNWGLNTPKIMKKHKQFIKRLNPETSYLRMILDSNDDAEFIIEQIKDIDFSNFSLVLQPFAKAPFHINDWDTTTILKWISILSPYFSEVRWLPQVHKLLRIP